MQELLDRRWTPAGVTLPEEPLIPEVIASLIKVRGNWDYLYRALDKEVNTINFYLSPTRSAKAAKRFLGKALNGLKNWDKPQVINTDKAPTYDIAISELMVEGKCPEDTVH